MIYELTSTVLRENAIVDLTSGGERFAKFFLDDDGKGDFIKFTKIKFKAQQGYAVSDMLTEDYLEASIGVPLFSHKFKASIEERLKNEVQLYPCEVYCRGQIFDFYVGKILAVTTFVDVENSIYRKLTDGRDVLSICKYKPSFSDDLYIARDVNFRHLFAASQKLVSLIESQKLNVKAIPLT